MHPDSRGLGSRPILVLNTCEERLQITLGGRGGLLLHQEWIVPSGTMGILGPAVEQAFKLLDLTPADLAGLACVRGPGSFTGIRIALSTALGFQAGCGVPLAGLDYLPLLARSAAPLRRGSLTMLTYARKGLVYAQSFALPSCHSLSDLTVFDPEQAAAHIATLPSPRLCAGSALRRVPQLTELLDPQKCELLPSVLDRPSAEALLAAALEATYTAEPVAPLYVRASDAEDNLPTFARQRGLAPEEARRLLEELTETPRDSR